MREQLRLRVSAGGCRAIGRILTARPGIRPLIPQSGNDAPHMCMIVVLRKDHEVLSERRLSSRSSPDCWALVGPRRERTSVDVAVALSPMEGFRGGGAVVAWRHRPGAAPLGRLTAPGTKGFPRPSPDLSIDGFLRKHLTTPSTITTGRPGRPGSARGARALRRRSGRHTPLTEVSQQVLADRQVAGDGGGGTISCSQMGLPVRKKHGKVVDAGRFRPRQGARLPRCNSVVRD